MRDRHCQIRDMQSFGPYEPEQRHRDQGKDVEWHVSRTLSRPSMLLATAIEAVSRRDILQPTAFSPTQLFGCARLTLEMRLVHSLLQKEPLICLSKGDQTDAVRSFTRTRRTALKNMSLNMVLLSYEEPRGLLCIYSFSSTAVPMV